jgi:UDP-GlcNAc:undecaprenyl-phosphate GlcNAc-1-phosphate transferase
MQFVVGSSCALLLALMLTPVVRALAGRFAIVAAPRRDRWHQNPTALLGGIAIYGAFLACSLAFAPRIANFYVIFGCATLLFVVGLIDDLVQIKPYAKLIAQLIAAAVAVYFGLRLPWTGHEAVNDFITIFWLVGITNAINLLDNMDGLAGGVAVISCVFLAVTFMLNGQAPEAIMTAILAGSILGFLAYNFHPASIFMGDCGSMFVGFMLGGTALLSQYGRSRNLTSVLLAPVLILMIPIFDTCMVTVARKLSGRPISQGGRDHASHRLVAMGMSEKRAVLMLYAFAACSGALALAVRLLEVEIVLLLVPVFALVVLFLGLHLGKVVVYEEGRQPPANAVLDFIADFSHKRRIFEVLLDVVLVVLAYYGAYLLRFDGSLPADQLSILVRTLPVVIIIQMLVFLIGGVYQGMWRYAGVGELIVMAKSVFAGTAATLAVVLFMYGFRGPSRAVFVLDALLLLFFVGASRLSFRVLRTLLVGEGASHPDARPVLIYGAGDGGEILVREIMNNPDHRYTPIGFIDDDVRKAGKLIHGVRIFDSRDLPHLIHAHRVSEVLISSLKLPESKIDYLRSMGVGFKKMSIRIE